MGAAFRAEWIKFRSLRSLAGLDLAAVVVTLAITYLHCHGYHLGSTDNAAAISMFGVTLGMFFAGLAGALLATSEHASGTIAATIAAIPRRGRVAAAKAALIASLGLTAGTAVALGSFLLGQAAFASSPLRESLSSPGALRVILGGGLVLTLVSLLGLGLGLLFRRAVAAMSTLVVLLYLLPLVTAALSAATRRAVVRYLPDQLVAPLLAGRQTSGIAPSLNPWAALAVLAAEIGLTLICGAAVLARRDV
jgi:ABC-2 type transport system permease protein